MSVVVQCDGCGKIVPRDEHDGWIQVGVVEKCSGEGLFGLKHNHVDVIGFCCSTDCLAAFGFEMALELGS